jgi:iron complex outermembrane receptor protein
VLPPTPRPVVDDIWSIAWITSLVASFVLGGMGSAAIADDQAVPKAPKEKEDFAEIVVTGSRIARPDLDRLQPTTILNSEYLDRRAYTNVVDALNELPSFGEPDTSLVGGQSSFGVGQSFAAFFGLGSQRTLTLVDGRRFVPANSPSIYGATGAGGEQVDLNIIPTQLIDRIETIAIGGAPIYGSDAIAGTVNIILKHDYTGVDVDVSAGISGHADAAQERLRLLIGKNFSEGRGNLEISAEIANSAGLVGDQRRQIAYDDAYIPSGGASPYTYVLSANQRVGGVSTMGVPLVDDGYLNVNPNFAITNPNGRILAFNYGSLAPYAPGPPDPTGIYNIGGDGIDLATLTTLLSPQERINGTVLGNFIVNEHANVYGEFWYSETHTDIPVAQAEYNTSAFAPAGQRNGNLVLNVNNAFLSTADQATIARNLAAYAAIPGNPAQTSQFYLTRLNQEIGNGGTTADQNTTRVVLGVKGGMGFSDWQYDLSGNYGQTRNSSIAPLLNFQNFNNALNAVVGPGGTIICAPGYTTSPVPTQSGTCAPFNPFGHGIASRAADAYVTDLASAVSTLTQRVFTASMGGTVFSLPAGRVKLSAGYENRRESADFQPDQFYQQGLGYIMPIGPTQGSFVTNELFGEVLIPIVSPAMSIPGVRQLEIEAAAREVNHSIAGQTATWTAGARWAPLSILQFRGNYTRAIRAPSITEAFTPTTESTAGAIDPCDQSQISIGPDPAIRAKNCAAAGIKQPFISNVLSFPGPITVSGDPHLRNEIADSRTVGFVLRPMSRMTLAVDYVSVNIEDVIGYQDATSIFLECYDNPSFPNVDCARITRNASGQVTLVKTGFESRGFSTFNGITTEFNYTVGAGNWGTLDVRLNHFFQNHNSVSSAAENTIDFNEIIGYSKHKASIDLTWNKNRISALWHARYTGHSLFGNSLPANYSQITGLAGWWVNDLTVGVTPIGNLKLQLVIDNVFDKQVPHPFPASPPVNVGGGLSTYFSGLMGRYFVLSVNYRL